MEGRRGQKFFSWFFFFLLSLSTSEEETRELNNDPARWSKSKAEFWFWVRTREKGFEVFGYKERKLRKEKN